MRGKRNWTTCGRCGRAISERTCGGPVAHKCPHGRTCVAPAWTRISPSCDDCAKLYPQGHAPRQWLGQSSSGKGGAA